jgi:CotH protein/lamin tail-like protein
MASVYIMHSHRYNPFIFYILFIFSLSTLQASQKADFAEAHPVFDDTTLSEIRVEIAPQHLEEILRHGNEKSDIYFPATFHFRNHLIDDTISSIGLRLRGNTTRYAEKKSFKVSFNEFSKGRRFYGLKKLNLNAEKTDPAICRSKICWNLFNEFGVPAPRANHVRFYINNEYRGLYVNVEHVDSIFLQSRFGSSSGNLYKCLFLIAEADLSYKGNEKYNLVGDGFTYQLKTNEDNPDFSDLANFIDIINNTPDIYFKEEIEKVFNVEGFLRWMTVNNNTGTWDDYLMNATNYYLYHNPQSGRFEFIPYDYDNTLGISWAKCDWAERDVYEYWNKDKKRPLAERILSMEEYEIRFSQLLHSYIHSFFIPEKIDPEINRLHSMIKNAAEEDIYRTLDYGWTIDDFNRSFSEALESHVKYGMKEFIKVRRENTLKQLKPFPSPSPTPTPTPVIDCSTTPTIIINEFCASNSNGITDNMGEYEDWIEIFNYGMSPVNIGGMFISDNPEIPHKFKFSSDLIIDAGSYQLFFADEDEFQGADHVSFKISKEGESLILSRRKECGGALLDKIDFGPQEVNTSYGRESDAAENWIIFQNPTPGFSNNK